MIAVDKRVVRARAPELRWANGTMTAHLDVSEKLWPDVYLGRLEGTAVEACGSLATGPGHEAGRHPAVCAARSPAEVVRGAINLRRRRLIAGERA